MAPALILALYLTLLALQFLLEQLLLVLDLRHLRVCGVLSSLEGGLPV